MNTLKRILWGILASLLTVGGLFAAIAGILYLIPVIIATWLYALLFVGGCITLSFGIAIWQQLTLHRVWRKHVK